MNSRLSQVYLPILYGYYLFFQCCFPLKLYLQVPFFINPFGNYVYCAGIKENTRSSTSKVDQITQCFLRYLHYEEPSPSSKTKIECNSIAILFFVLIYCWNFPVEYFRYIHCLFVRLGYRAVVNQGLVYSWTAIKLSQLRPYGPRASSPQYGKQGITPL